MARIRNPLETTARQAANLAINVIRGTMTNSGLNTSPVSSIPPQFSTDYDATTGKDIAVMIWDLDEWDDPNRVWSE